MFWDVFFFCGFYLFRALLVHGDSTLDGCTNGHYMFVTTAGQTSLAAILGGSSVSTVYRWWFLRHFCIFTSKNGEMIQFDEHMNMFSKEV